MRLTATDFNKRLDTLGPDWSKVCRVDRCPSCQSRWVRRRRVPWFARPVKRLTPRRPYVCDSCGWHGWRPPVLAAGVAAQHAGAQTRARAKVAPRAATAGADARTYSFLELFASEKLTPQDGIPQPRPQFVHRVKHLSVLRSDMLRAFGIFVLGVTTGIVAFWIAIRPVPHTPSVEGRSPMAASATTGARPAEPLPQSQTEPAGAVASLGQMASGARQRQSPRAISPDTSKTAAVSSRPAPSRRERPSPERTRPTAQRAPAAARPASAAAPTPSRGILEIDSDPQGAQVTVNGRRVGSTPIVLEDAPAGTQLVRVEAQGYQPWAWTARVVANQRSRVSAKLYSSSNR
jgi:PEGA domain